MSTRMFAGLLAASTLLGGGAALAQQQGTEAERIACTPDVFRLCGQFIPDAARIEACLRAAGPQLSPACHIVFYPPQAAKPPLRTVRRNEPTPARQSLDARDAKDNNALTLRRDVDSARNAVAVGDP
jgi:hypothetical protein